MFQFETNRINGTAQEILSEKKSSHYKLEKKERKRQAHKRMEITN